MKITNLRKRADFVRASTNGAKQPTRSLVLLANKITVNTPNVAEGTSRVGFTATKKLGGAVVRNRIKRRLRAAVQLVLKTAAKPNYDYVLIGRTNALTLAFSEIVNDLKYALRKLNLT